MQHASCEGGDLWVLPPVIAGAEWSPDGQDWSLHEHGGAWSCVWVWRLTLNCACWRSLSTACWTSSSCSTRACTTEAHCRQAVRGDSSQRFCCEH